MYCPRIKHFVRLNQNGSIGKCGHMINGMEFKTVKALEESEWIKKLKDTMAQDKWPEECVRCQETEEVNGESIRTKSIDRHKVLHPFKDDYLVVGGVMDNICNSACQTCYSGLSTKIGSLEGKNYPRIDNYERFWEIPQKRILEVDVNGGEPTASKNYKKILSRLPSNTKIVRMNTNGSRMIKELELILKNRITKDAKKKLKNSSYAVCREIAKKVAIEEDNSKNLDLYIKRQDYLRKIDINDYFNLD